MHKLFKALIHSLSEKYLPDLHVYTLHQTKEFNLNSKTLYAWHVHCIHRFGAKPGAGKIITWCGLRSSSNNLSFDLCVETICYRIISFIDNCSLYVLVLYSQSEMEGHDWNTHKFLIQGCLLYWMAFEWKHLSMPCFQQTPIIKNSIQQWFEEWFCSMDWRDARWDCL